MDPLKNSMGWRQYGSQVIRATVALLVIFAIATFSGSPVSGREEGAVMTRPPLQNVSQRDHTLIAYSVDYEMDKARGEKTVEHYGESMRPIVKQAIKNNENNPNSKDTAENTYRRESPLNDLLPERVGQFFSKKDLLNMPRTDNPQKR